MKMNKFLKKKVILSLIFILIILIAINLFVLNKQQMKLKKTSITIEYGEKIPLQAKNYLVNDTEDYVIHHVSIVSDAQNEKDKDYPAVGNYTVVLTYKKEIKKVKVIIKDTTKPIIEGPDNIEIIQGTDLEKFDFSSLFTVMDLSQLQEVKYHYSNIVIDKIGEYDMKISVADQYDNVANRTIKVIVKEKPESEKKEIIIQKNTTKDYEEKEVKVIKKTIDNQNDLNSNSKVTESDTNIDKINSNNGFTNENITNDDTNSIDENPSYNSYTAKCKYCQWEIIASSTEEATALAKKHIEDNLWTKGCGAYIIWKN